MLRERQKLLSTLAELAKHIDKNRLVTEATTASLTACVVDLQEQYNNEARFIAEGQHHVLFAKEKGE